MDFRIIVALACLFIGLSKGGLGGPIPVAMLTPLLSQIMPAAQAVGIVLVPLLIGDLIAIWFYWRQWDSARIKLLLPAAVVGVVIGSLLLRYLADSGQDVAIKLILGIFTLIVVVYKVASSRLTAVRYEPRQWHGWLAGWGSGFGSALANVGAPPYTAYMLLQKIDNPVVFIGTTSLFFAIVNALKLPFVLANKNILDFHLLLSIAWALPLIPVGAYLGRYFVSVVNPKVFEQLMLVLLFLLSVYTLGDAISKMAG
ncbi:MAG: sulfite exporter TauE/SafE family protein [Chloroflexi bacterium]|nr:sulfite exporter TauE/SafE family protein [Chloroflexota bacterium]MCC6893535.1 sulfite exporter TauE/SafE family protein [Anaerolineae bacterium]